MVWNESVVYTIYVPFLLVYIITPNDGSIPAEAEFWLLYSQTRRAHGQTSWFGISMCHYIVATCTSVYNLMPVHQSHTHYYSGNAKVWVPGLTALFPRS